MAKKAKQIRTNMAGTTPKQPRGRRRQDAAGRGDCQRRGRRRVIRRSTCRPARSRPRCRPISRSARRSSASCRTCCIAYAFDNAKLEAFVAYLQRPDAGAVRPLQARARDDRGRGVVAEPLLLLPHRAWRGGAHLFGRSGARRADGDELSRRAGSTRRQRAMLDFAVKLTTESWAIEEEDRDALRRAGFSRPRHLGHRGGRRLLQHVEPRRRATDMRPNAVYHGQGR